MDRRFKCLEYRRNCGFKLFFRVSEGELGYLLQKGAKMQRKQVVECGALKTRPGSKVDRLIFNVYRQPMENKSPCR